MTGREVGRELAERTALKLLVATVLSISVLSVPLAVVGKDPDPHKHFREPWACSECHVVRRSVPDPGRFVAGADAFCLGCHSAEGLGITHPRNIRPAEHRTGMKVPGDLPLDAEGRIFCLTCHRAHGPFLSPARAFASQKPANPDAPPGTKPLYRTYFARRSDPVKGFAVLCEGCHRP